MHWHWHWHWDTLPLPLALPLTLALIMALTHAMHSVLVQELVRARPDASRAGANIDSVNCLTSALFCALKTKTCNGWYSRQHGDAQVHTEHLSDFTKSVSLLLLVRDMAPRCSMWFHMAPPRGSTWHHVGTALGVFDASEDR
jgi:hypothetical protein